FVALLVIITLTSAPCCTNLLVKSHALYTAIPPVTPNNIFLFFNKVHTSYFYVVCQFTFCFLQLGGKNPCKQFARVTPFILFLSQIPSHCNFLLKLILDMLELLARRAMYLHHLGYPVHDGQKSLLTYILNHFVPVKWQLVVLAYYSSFIMCLNRVSMRSLSECSVVII